MLIPRPVMPMAPPDVAALDRDWQPTFHFRMVRPHWWSRDVLQQKWKGSAVHPSGYKFAYEYEWRDVDCVKVDRDGRDISGTTEW